MSVGRVLYVVSEPWYFANHRLDHARGLIADGFDVHVATRAGDRADELSDAGCVLHHLDMVRGTSGLRSWWAETRALRSVVRSAEPDILHAVALKPVALAMTLLGFRRRPALVLSVNGLGISASQRSPGLALFCRAVRFAGRRKRVALLFQTKVDQRSIDATETLGVVIPGVGVDLDVFAPAEKTSGPPFIVVYLGRAVRSKGLMGLAAAGQDSRISEAGIEIHLYCALDEASPGAISAEEMAVVSASPAVTVHPPTSNPSAVLAAAHAAVLPSIAGEGVSKFVLEAFASGTPILLSADSGSAEVVTDGVDGLTFQSADSGAIVDALLRFSTMTAAERTAMSEASRALAESKYGTNIIVPAIVALHTEMMVGRRG